MPREVYVVHADITATFPTQPVNSVGHSRGSTFSSLDTDAPLQEPSARSVRRIKRQAAAETTANTAPVARVATGVDEPNVTVASSDAFTSAPHGAVACAVASEATLISHAFAPAPHSDIATTLGVPSSWRLSFVLLVRLGVTLPFLMRAVLLRLREQRFRRLVPTGAHSTML